MCYDIRFAITVFCDRRNTTVGVSITGGVTSNGDITANDCRSVGGGIARNYFANGLGLGPTCRARSCGPMRIGCIGYIGYPRRRRRHVK